MLYLDSFSLPTEVEELDFVLSNRSRKLDMACYNQGSAYPFQVFPQKGFSYIDFAPITILYGGNGSGKSTLLNVIAEKLSLERTTRYNKTPLMEEYLSFCSYESHSGARRMPRGSAIITSDGVFDFLLDLRAINEGIDSHRESLFNEYFTTRENTGFQMRSLDDYEELKHRNEIKRTSLTQYTAKRMQGSELNGKSNGESAFHYFTKKIEENALYLLDEPENSLSATLQAELAKFLYDSARFFGCQLIISTHSPFLLAIEGAKIYDLDARPVSEKPWTSLANVRAYYDLFKSRDKDFS